MNNPLSLTRIVNLMKHDLIVRKKNILITAVTIILLLALVPGHITSTNSAYFNVLFIGGFVITAMSFKELCDQKSAAFYLTLPASNIERFVSKWFMTSIGYALGLLVVYCAFGLLSLLINQVVFGQTFYMFNLLSPALWAGISKYIILQSVVLLGAITFKKNVLVKTALVVSALSILFGLASVLFVYIFCPNCLIGGFAQLVMSSMYGANFIFWIVLAPFCWYITYLKLTEVEIR